MADKQHCKIAWANRRARAYGTGAIGFMGKARSLADSGKHVGDCLTKAEVDYPVEQEWAMTADDILWRRTKPGPRIAPKDATLRQGYRGAKVGG